MSRLHCSQVRAFLMAWMDSELDAGRTVEVSEHLRTCADCRRRFERETHLEEGLAAVLREEAMPMEVTHRLHNALRPDRRSGGTWRWVAAAAVLIVAVTLTLYDAGESLPPDLTRGLVEGHLALLADESVLDGEQVLRSRDAVEGLLAERGFGEVKMPRSRTSEGHPVELVGAWSDQVLGTEAVRVVYRCCEEVSSLVFVDREALAAALAPEGLPEGELDPQESSHELEGVQQTLVGRGEALVGVSGSHDLAGLIDLVRI